MDCIDARNGIDAIFILYEFNCLIAEENRVLPLVMAENLCSRIGGTAARRKNIWKSRLKFDIMNT